MAAFSPQSYPRPDFERTKLRWQSLNGPWDFLFDDDDVGLSQRWQHHGIPGQVEVTGTQGSVSEAAKNITAKIAAGTQNLIQNNTFSASAKTQQKRTIQVPYVFQCPASGIHEKGVHEVLWYERKISDPRSDEAKSKHDKVLLRFGAVDYDATVWIDGQYVGGHRGGHVPFEIDITDALESTTSSKPSSDDPRRLTLRVYDSAYDLTQPRGKQYWGAQPESIFYTPSSGIWQNVWIEVVPAARLADSSRGTYLRSNDIESGNLHARVAVSGRRVGQKCNVELVSSFAGIKVATSESKELPLQTDHVNLDLSMRMTGGQTKDLPAAVAKDAPLEDPACWHHGVALWSPERPLLYDVSLRLLDTQSNVLDEVKTQVGMRSLNWTSDDSTFRLNGRPYFQALCLDQGYWADTFMTPPSADALKADVQLSKNMGFNGCRKHQKVEDPIFLYWADKLGYVVWGEMANAYEFGQEYIERYDQEWMEAVRLGINHPCILTWTPVNESWGYTDLKGNADHRNHIRSLYYMTKSLDPTRPINDNCGWEHVMHDLITFHDYADGPDLEKTCESMSKILSPKGDRPVFLDPLPARLDPGSQPRAGAPVMCTELGGINIVPQGAKKGERDWGYTTASDPQDLLKRIERCVMGVVNGGFCCGIVYTQLADIEQEVNGVYSIDRKEKLDAKQMKAMFDEARRVYNSKH